MLAEFPPRKMKEVQHPSKVYSQYHIYGNIARILRDNLLYKDICITYHLYTLCSRTYSVTPLFMLTTIAGILVILWLVGFIGFHVVDGFIHILIVIAFILLLLRIIRSV